MGALRFSNASILGSGKRANFLAGFIPPSIAGYVPAVSDGNTDKFAFPTEVRTIIGSTFSSVRGSAVGASNTQVAGYVAGGSPALSSIQKMTLPAETVSTISATLTSGRRQFAGMENHGVAGYFGTGYGEVGGSGVTSNMNKLSYATEVNSSTTSASVGTYGAKGFANSGTAGYVLGGFNGSSRIGTVDKFAFPADGRSTLGTGLSVGVFEHAATENYQVAGYRFGGNDGSNPRVSSVDKFAFPSDSRTTLGTGLSAAKEGMSGFSHAGVAGYNSGGYNGSSAVTTVDRFAYPSDSRTSLGIGLSTASQANAAFESL